MPLKTLPSGTDDRFDVLTVNAVLKGIVREKPAGFRYTDPEGCPAGKGAACTYADRDGSPSCLVGQVVYRLGITLPAWGTWENSEGIRHGADRLAEYFTPEARERLARVQDRQDEGQTWARSIC